MPTGTYHHSHRSSAGFGGPSAASQHVGGHHTLMQNSHHHHGQRPSSYHYEYEGESLDELVSNLKLNDRRKKRMNKILEKTSQQFSQ